MSVFAALRAYVVVSGFGAVGCCVVIDGIASQAVHDVHELFLLELVWWDADVEHFNPNFQTLLSRGRAEEGDFDSVASWEFVY